MFRDLPEGTGAEKLAHVFQSTPNLIGIRKVVGNNKDSPINPPPELSKLGQIGANDVLLDADTKIRRYFLYLASKTGEIVPSFGLRLAEIYLNKLGILAKPSAINADYLQFGQTVFVPFKENDGGYVHANAQGYQILLNYRGPANSFSMISVTDVLEDRIPANFLRDRIVLIGSITQSQKDFFLTPYSSTPIGIPDETSGVEIHANLISQILSSVLSGRSLIQTWTKSLEFWWIFAWSVVGATLSWKWRYTGGFTKFLFQFVVGVLLPFGSLLGICYLAFLSGWWIPLIPPTLALLGSAITINAYIARTADNIRNIFSRYLTDEVVESLLETPTGLKLGGERRKITILMSDLRGFSAISERLSPEKVVEMLNIYLEKMTDVITEYQGTIGDFIGDAILVLFGAPTQRKDDPERGVACAIAMQQAMFPLNEQLEGLGLPKLQMGIGLNTGEVIVGNIGSKKRAKYDVIGSPINLTSRIESYTAGGEIFISEWTLQEIKDVIKIHKLMSVQPKGFDEHITIYDVGGIAGKYQLFLPKEEDILVHLKTEIPLNFAIIQGKHIDEKFSPGNLVKLSINSAEIHSEYAVEPFSNIKIQLLIKPEMNQKFGDIYAKVSGKLADSNKGFYIRFTLIPPELTSILADLVTNHK